MTLAALLLSGCGTTRAGSGSGDASGGTNPTGPATSASPSAAASELKVTVRADANAAPTTWTLRCDPPGGDHPDPAAACAAIAKAIHPFAPTAKGVMCTQIYGGPQTATVAGSWNGEPVNASYRRTDGCEVGRWKQLAPVFHIPLGSAPKAS